MIVYTKEQLEEVYRAIENGPRWVGIDTEAYGPLTAWKEKRYQVVDPLLGKVAGISLASGSATWYTLAFDGNPTYDTDPGAVKEFVEKLFRLEKRFWFHNADYDLRILRNFLGYTPEPYRLGDTMVLAERVGQGVMERDKYGGIRWKHGLKELVLKEFGHKMTSYEELIDGKKILVSGPTDEEIEAELIGFVGSREMEELKHEYVSQKWAELELKNAIRVRDGKKPQKFNKQKIIDKAELVLLKNKRKFLAAMQVYRDAWVTEIDQERVARYAEEDAYYTLRLAEKYFPLLDREMGYTSVYDTVDMPYVYVIRGMHDTGIPLDKPYLDKMAEDMAPGIGVLEAEWKELTGVDITSPQQCVQAIYHDLKAWPVDDTTPVTPNDGLSVGKAAMEWAMNCCPEDSLGYRLASIKKQHAKLYKQFTTYTQSLCAQLPYRGGERVYPQYHIVGTNTGRLSSSDPNAQNFTRPEPGKPGVRGAIVAPAGYRFVSGDWSQLELFILAHLSRDPILIDALVNKKDIHSITAEKLGISRTIAKAVVYLTCYGGTEYKLSKTANVDLDSARQAIDTFRDTYRGISELERNLLTFARYHGYVETFHGRRRWLPDINSDNRKLRAKAERQVLNTAIQGTAADICKRAGVIMHESWKKNAAPARLMMNVHDEWVAEVREDYAEEAAAFMKQVMENCEQLTVPLRAEVKIGRNLAELK